MKKTSYSWPSPHGLAVTLSIVSAVGSFMSQQSPTRRSFEDMSPPRVMSPVDDRLALLMNPAMAPPPTRTAKISSPSGTRRHSGRLAAAATG